MSLSGGEVTLADVLRVRSDLKQQGNEWHGPCPFCGGKDRWWVHEPNGTLVIKCRNQPECTATFRDHLQKLGFLGDESTNGHGQHITPVWSGDPARVTVEYRWTDLSDGSTVIQTRTDPGKVIRWPKGTSKAALVYLAGPADSDRIIFCEGAKAADAAALLFPYLRIIGLPDAKTVPKPDLLRPLVEGRIVAIWPDNDVEGVALGHLVATAAHEAKASEVKWIDPLALGLSAAKSDAADWTPKRDAANELRQAITGVPVDDRIDDLAPLLSAKPPEPIEPICRGLAWPGRITLVHGGPGSGKTTIAAAACATVSKGGNWLGFDLEPGRILWLGPDDPAVGSTMMEFGAKPENVRIASDELLTDLGHLQDVIAVWNPALLVLDALSAQAARLGLNLDNTQQASALVLPFRQAASAGAGVVLLHHEPWGDIEKLAGRPRNSTAIAGDVDAIVRVSLDDDCTNIQRGMKARREIQTENLRCRLLPGRGFILVESGTITTAADADIQQSIVDYISSHPGANMNSIKRVVKGQGQAVSNAVKALRDRGRLVLTIQGQEHAYTLSE